MKILRTLKILEVAACDKPANKLARAVIMKSDTTTQAARDDAIAALREKKIQTAIDEKGLSRKEAEAMVGLEQNIKSVQKAAPTEADTAVASIEALADYENQGVSKHIAIAKFLETDTGRSLYTSFSDAKNEPVGRAITKRQYSNHFDALVDVYVKQHGMNHWKASNEVLKTKLGAAIYKEMNEAA